MHRTPGCLGSRRADHPHETIGEGNRPCSYRIGVENKVSQTVICIPCAGRAEYAIDAWLTGAGAGGVSIIPRTWEIPQDALQLRDRRYLPIVRPANLLGVHVIQKDTQQCTVELRR